ncbi:hypothetical protein Tco_0369219 [Tanacetum coccineum]
MSMMGEMKFFLGLQVHQFPRDLFISQLQYTLEILKKHDMDGCNTIGTPMTTTPKLDVDLHGIPIDQPKYRSMIGSLMYLTSSRPYIVFFTFLCARYQARPTEKHLKEVKRIFRYLKKTYNIRIWYPKDSDFELTMYSDADHACYLGVSKGTSGGVRFLGDKLMEYQLADLFTKALAKDRFEQLVRRLDMAPLPAADQRHHWLRYQIEEYTEGIRHSYEQRLETIWSRPVNQVHVLDFEGLTPKMRQDLAVRLRMVYSGEGQQDGSDRLILDKGDLRDYWIEISSGRDFLGPAPSYVLIRDLDTGQVNSSKALDASLVDTESSGTTLKEQDTSSRSGNDAHVDDADIRPIYDEEPMAESKGTKNIEYTTSLIENNDKFKAQLQEKGFAIAALKNELRKLTGNSVNTKFSKQWFASQVDVNNDLSKPVTTHYLPKEREYAVAKPHHMIAPGSSRYSSNDMVHKHYLEEAKKKIQESSRNSEPSVMPSARSQSTTNGSKPKPRIKIPISLELACIKSSCVTTKTVPIAEHSRNSRSFSDSKHFVCSTCQKCVFNANHDSCVTKFLNEVNSRAKVPSHKTTTRYKPVEQKSFAKKPERQIPIGHRFSIKKTSVVHEKTMTPRSCLRWKPTGKIFKTVGLKWIPTGKIFTSSTTKVDSEPTNGSNDDITNQYECEQTLDVSAGTLNIHAAMTSDHNSSELRIHDHNNELSSSKLVPKVVPPADKTATSRQELELLFHHHITMLRSYALSWKPCQGDSLNLPGHRIYKDGDSDALFQLKTDSLPHAHAQTTRLYYKHRDSDHESSRN